MAKSLSYADGVRPPAIPTAAGRDPAAYPVSPAPAMPGLRPAVVAYALRWMD